MSGSNNQNAHRAAELAMGAFQELAKQGGASAGSPHGVAKVGAYIVQGTAVVAPVVAAKAGIAAAATVAAATAAAPFVATAGVGLGVYWLYRKLTS